MANELVSIVIVNYNGYKYLLPCVKSVMKNSYKNFEVIIVDNNSQDNSIGYLKEKIKDLSQIKFVILEKNFGLTKARNAGIKVAKGVYVGFLDNDTVVHNNWITEAVNLFKKDKSVGCIGCKILLLKERNKFDYAGSYLSNLGFLVHRATYGEIDSGQYDQEVEILAAKGAGMFFKKTVLDIAQGFDEDYIIYMDETEICWKSWLMGYKTMFCPNSIVYHHFSMSKKILTKNENTYSIRFNGTKNYILTLLKYLEVKNLFKILPLQIIVWFGLSLYNLLKGNLKASIYIQKGIFWNLLNIKKTITKRKKVQSSRVISDSELFQHIMKKINLLNKIKDYFVSEKIETTID